MPQDFLEAVRWYHHAAEQGHADAQSNLGVMYHRGEEVPQDNLKAVMWYHRAAEQGHAFAQSNLGVMYAKGAGVPQDYARAHMWFNIAASSGKGYAREIRAQARKMKSEVEKKMSPAQIIEAEQLAKECIERNYKGCC